MKLLFALVAVLLSNAASINADGCGGLLESDAGQLEFPVDGNSNGESSCLWIIKLVTGSGIRFTLNRLDSSSIISLYPEHESSETVLQPIRLEITSVNSTVLTTGKVLLVTLAQAGSSSGVSFSWESDAEEDTSEIIKAASYVDTPEGRVAWTKFGQQERLTWGLTLDTSVNLRVQAVADFGRCDLIDPCRCTYFALYEVTPEGYLREATRVCGRPSNATIENLYPQLVAFIYVNVTGVEDQTASVELTWLTSTRDEETTTTTTTTTTTETTTTDTPSAQQLQCGGVLSIPTGEEQYYEYKAEEYYDNNEFCIWVLNGTEYAWRALYITVESSGFEASYDGLAGFDIVYENFPLANLRKCEFTTTVTTCTLLGGLGLFAFSSDGSNQGRGFRIKIEAVDPQVAYNSAFFFDETRGAFKYPEVGNYRNDEEVLAVFQQNQPNFLQLTSLRTEASYDPVAFFTITPFRAHANATFDGRWSGSYPSGVEGSLSYAEYPRVAIFASDGSNTGAGFEITYSAEGEPETTTPEGPPAQTLECGGVLSIPVGVEQYYEYKAEELYDNNEFCIWVLNGTSSSWGTLSITVESSEFEVSSDGLQGFDIVESSSRRADLRKCELYTSCTLVGGLGLLVFSSDDSNKGNGFRIKIEATDPLTGGFSTAFFFDDTRGVFKYPAVGNYRNGEEVLAVFQQNQPNFLQLTSLQTEATYDFVAFYTIRPFRDHANATDNGRWSGSYPSGVEGSLSYAEYPRVALFSSDNSNTGAGFEITWGAEDELETTIEPPLTQTLECGGTIKFSSPANFYIEYKFNEYYFNSDFCVWAFESDNQWGQISVTMESEGFETNFDGLAAYSLNSTDNVDVTFEQCKLPSAGTSCTLENGVGFLAFSSDSSGIGYGFRARIVVTAQARIYLDSVHFTNETQGVFRYPSDGGTYLSRERVLAIFQPQRQATNTFTYKLASLSTEKNFDFVHLFTLKPFGEANNIGTDGRWSGEYPDGVTEALTSSRNPRVALFLTDNSNQYNGFSIEWEQGTDSRNSVLSQKNPMPIPLMWANLKSYVHKSQSTA